MTSISPIGSILFFYTFFGVMVMYLLYALWEVHLAQLRRLPNPLSATLVGVPDSMNLFEEIQAILRVENCGKTPLKKVQAICGNSWIFPLAAGAYLDLPIKLNTSQAGRHQLQASVYCKQWELHIFCWYHVFQKKVSQREKYLKVLGLKPGASRAEIKRARKRLAKKYHPDLGNGYEEKMKEINEAYDQLMALNA